MNNPYKGAAWLKPRLGALLAASVLALAAPRALAGDEQPHGGPPPKAAPAHPGPGPGAAPHPGGPGYAHPEGPHPGPGGEHAAYAEHRDFERHEFREHDFHRFDEHDRALWQGGGWHHEWHNGHYGWWWFAGGSWYFYDAPVYPYPLVVSDTVYVEPVAPAPVVYTAPPPAPVYVVQQPPPPPPAPVVAPPPQFQYYCDNPPGYYPAVPDCPTAFRKVPVQP